MTSTTHPIPLFYYLFFTTIDPLIAVSGFYFSIFDPLTILRSLFPPSHLAYVITPTHTMLLQQFAGTFIMQAFLMVTMLRYTKDVGVWKFFEAGILICDLALFGSYWVGLKEQGRLDIGELRWEEWSSLAITGFITIMRGLFVAGVGLRSTSTRAKKKN